MQSEQSRPKVYLAGPDGFTPAGLDWHRNVLIPAVRALELEPLSPWDNTSEEWAELEQSRPSLKRQKRLAGLSDLAGEANADMIDRSVGVLAVLDGPDVDSGTAAEIGYASRAGCVIVGLRTDTRRTGDNEGVTVNLQVEYFIRRSGGTIERDVGSAVRELAERIGKRLHP